jgi:Bifunctional DNA primase/polymerase, N-terminal
VLDQALKYAARGVAVFPCWPASKEPACRRGFKDATTNPAMIRRWWLANSSYNIAIATGIVSRVWVLDVDGDDGVTSLAALEAKHGRLPDTLTSLTGNGQHLWFRYDSPVPCSADDRIGRGLHVRGDGGYVLAPPSVHPDGPRYRWANVAPLAIAPDQLIALTRKRPTVSERAMAAMSGRPQTSPDRYGKAALEREISELAQVPPGGRNHALNRASFRLHQLVAGGEIDGAEVHARLLGAATANGLMSDPGDGPRSVERTIASGARAGLQQPRNRRGGS